MNNSRKAKSLVLMALLSIDPIFAVAASRGGPTAVQVGEDGTRLGRISDEARSVTYAPFPASGPSLNVAIVASASGNVTDPFFTDPQNRLLSSGYFVSVSIIHAGQVTPTVNDLLTFDAILVWSNFDFANAAELGDNLADYVNGGGGVVVAVFANSTSSGDRFLAGRWLTHDYEIVPSQSGTATGSASLGIINLPAHPIVAGVTIFSGGTNSFRPTATAFSVPGQTDIVAEWDDGKTLAAVREDTVGSRIDLGFYPVSDAVLPGYWDETTDGGLLLANAVKYAAERTPLAPGDSDGDGDVDDDDFSKFQSCYTGFDIGIVPAGCVTFDFDRDDDIDCCDWTLFEAGWSGPGVPPVFDQCSDSCCDAAECFDGDPCTLDLCLEVTCSIVPTIYGDVDKDGTVNLFDLFCILNGFAGQFDVCTFEDVDIEPCGGNGKIDIFDLFAVLNAFSGNFACPPC